MDLLKSSPAFQIGLFVAVSIVVVVLLLSWRKALLAQRSLRQELDDLRTKETAVPAESDETAAGTEVQSGLATEEPKISDQSLLFLSYAHKDEDIAESLEVHLSPVLRRHNLRLWRDQRIATGQEWSENVADAIARSSVAIAIVSPDYLASEYTSRELPVLIEAQKESGLQLLWLPARPSAFETTELANYQGLLNPGQPLSMLAPDDREIALVTVAETISRYLDEAEARTSDGIQGHGAWIGGLPFRLEWLRLQNIRCFEEIVLDLSTKAPTSGDALPSLRTIFVGDNATGKSTLLRAIALGICEESGATALLNAMTGRMIRSGEKSGSIELRFRSDASNEPIEIYTEISTSQSGSEIVRKSGELPPNLIVAGYGTQRTRSGNEGHEQYDAATAVGTLFDDEARLQNPELVLLRQPRWIRMKVQEIVAGILDLQSDELEYRSDGVRVIGPWGRERLDVLSDGYRSTAQWILDFTSWIIYSGATTLSPQEVPAIVLFDELEQHLHPQWQRRIIERLREHLPNVQFLVTSHSPLIASSVTGLKDDGWREKLYYFGCDENGKVTATESEFLRGMSVEQVLASPAFDYLVDAEPSVAELYREASRLASKGNDRTAEEEEQYRRVKRIVGEILTIQDRTLVEQEAREDLNQQAEAKLTELEVAVFGEAR